MIEFLVKSDVMMALLTPFAHSIGLPPMQTGEFFHLVNIDWDGRLLIELFSQGDSKDVASCRIVFKPYEIIKFDMAGKINARNFCSLFYNPDNKYLILADLLHITIDGDYVTTIQPMLEDGHKLGDPIEIDLPSKPINPEPGVTVWDEVSNEQEVEERRRLG